MRPTFVHVLTGLLLGTALAGLLNVPGHVVAYQESIPPVSSPRAAKPKRELVVRVAPGVERPLVTKKAPSKPSVVVRKVFVRAVAPAPAPQPAPAPPPAAKPAVNETPKSPSPPPPPPPAPKTVVSNPQPPPPPPPPSGDDDDDDDDDGGGEVRAAGSGGDDDDDGGDDDGGDEDD
jgi:hypothetical protein